MDLIAHSSELYPLLLGLMALSGIALPVMAWWTKRH